MVRMWVGLLVDPRVVLSVDVKVGLKAVLMVAMMAAW